jgi:hypothetical protein
MLDLVKGKQGTELGPLGKEVERRTSQCDRPTEVGQSHCMDLEGANTSRENNWKEQLVAYTSAMYAR